MHELEATMSKTMNRGSLTKEQVGFYKLEGFLVLEDFLNDADLAGVRASMAARVDEIAADLFAAGLITNTFEDSPFELRLAHLFEGLDDKTFLKYGRSWRDRLPGYFDLMANPKILDVLESLIGPEIFSNPVYNTRPKVPKVAAGAVPWHQDKSYWPDANANPVITVWVPLVDATLENGCLHMMPRTHKQRLLSSHAETYSGTGFIEIDDKYIAKLLPEKTVVPLPVKKGTVILFNDRCIHKSTPNNSNAVRWSVDLRYQPTDQDPMPQHGAGFLARSNKYPERVATLEDWLANRPEHISLVNA
jgi:phytanoyl-CoA hydroxylase